jgi:chemotaxis protein MotB
MFGKRKDDHKHRFDEPPEDSAPLESDDPDLAEALKQLGRNRHLPLPEPDVAEQEDSGGSEELGDSDRPSEPGESESIASEDQRNSVRQETPDRPVWSAVPTAGMLAEPEPEPEPEREREREQPSAGQMAMQALNRERARTAEMEAALRTAQDEVASVKAQLRQVQAELAHRAESGTTAPSDGDVEELRSAAERADTAESSALELQSKVSELVVELEDARTDATAAGVALERLQRETKDRDTALAVAEERAERLAAEVQQLRTRSAKEPVQSGRSQIDAVRQIESVVAENRRLARELAANLQSQEAVVAALTGLQAEVTEQRAWFEAQLASMRDMEGQQAGVVDALQAAVKERDGQLDALRQQLLDVEAKRAEEAAAFVAALERQ